MKTLVANVYYYQDELGSTSHVASSSGALLEAYRYDLYGKPVVYDASGALRSTGTAYNVKDLFTGQRWIAEIGLYDDRNRFMSPDQGRFLQPDPIGFKGDSSNLYRYCHNDWANRSDPMGLDAAGGVALPGVARMFAGPDGGHPQFSEQMLDADGNPASATMAAAVEPAGTQQNDAQVGNMTRDEAVARICGQPIAGRVPTISIESFQAWLLVTYGPRSMQIGFHLSSERFNTRASHILDSIQMPGFPSASRRSALTHSRRNVG